MFVEYEPGAYIERIGPTPPLMVVAAGDQGTGGARGLPQSKHGKGSSL
jgi:hypothetical protein